MLCTEIVSDIQEQILYTTCSPHVLQKEELMTKIYLYQENTTKTKKPSWHLFF